MSGLIGSSPFVSRTEWQARTPKAVSTVIAPKGNTVHYEGPPLGDFAHSTCAAKIRGIQAYHMDHQGWSDIAYSSVECPHGYVYEGRWLGRRTAANGTNDGNLSSYAHCALMGEGDALTEPAKRAVHDVVAFFEANGSGAKKWGHRDWLATSCPGDLLEAFVRAGLVLAASTPPPLPPPPPGAHMNGPAVAAMASKAGYAIVGADGGVFCYGDFEFHGSAAGIHLAQPIVGAAPTPSGHGYWLVAADGGIFAYGDAGFLGSMGGKPLNKPIEGMAASAAGYVLVAGDGGVFPFGIPFVGSPA